MDRDDPSSQRGPIKYGNTPTLCFEKSAPAGKERVRGYGVFTNHCATRDRRGPWQRFTNQQGKFDEPTLLVRENCFLKLGIRILRLSLHLLDQLIQILDVAVNIDAFGFGFSANGIKPSVFER